MADTSDRTLRSMNRRFVYGALIISAVLGVVAAWWFFASGRQPGKEVQKGQAPAPSTALTSPASLAASGTSPYDEKLAREGIQAIFEGLKKGGWQEHPPAQKYLGDAVASRDKGKILRAFHEAIYSSNIWKMNEAIPALKTFLNNPDPFVRYSAGEALLTVGDQSGYPALLALVQASDPIEGIGQDVRIQAAQTLAKFRKAEAAQAIYDLYQETNAGGLIEALTTLEASQVKPLIGVRGFFAESASMKYYVLNGVQKFIPQMTSAFQESPKPEVKVAAAWALATMTNNQNAFDYLVQTAQPAINAQAGAAGLPAKGGNREAFAAGYDALKYLGSIQTPQSKQTLETALDSQIPTVVQVATVNLIFNQGGSEKANRVVAQALSDGTKNMLGVDLALNLAAQINDPQVQVAGQKFAQQEGTGLWQLYTVERKDWPIYNWIDNYVVKLNR